MRIDGIYNGGFKLYYEQIKLGRRYIRRQDCPMVKPKLEGRGNKMTDNKVTLREAVAKELYFEGEHFEQGTVAMETWVNGNPERLEPYYKRADQILSLIKSRIEPLDDVTITGLAVEYGLIDIPENGYADTDDINALKAISQATVDKIKGVLE